jgi:hypothetical protein
MVKTRSNKNYALNSADALSVNVRRQSSSLLLLQCHHQKKVKKHDPSRDLERNLPGAGHKERKKTKVQFPWLTRNMLNYF